MKYCVTCKRFVGGSKWEDGKTRCEQCGSSNLVKAKLCKCCREPSLQDYCDWCLDEATAAVRWFVSKSPGDGGLQRINLLKEACDIVLKERNL